MVFYWLHVPLSRPAEGLNTRHAVIRFTPVEAGPDVEQTDARILTLFVYIGRYMLYTYTVPSKQSLARGF